MLGAVLSIAVGGQLSLDGPAHAQAAETFRDDFGAISYAGNDGSATWSGSWRESGEADGPTAGSVQVVASDRCLGGTGNCLRIGTDGGDLANHGASREADLSDATSASLSFHYRRQFQGKPTGSISIQVSGDGGSTWATAGTIPLTGPQGPSSASFDISAHTGARTVVRIRLSGQGVAGYLYLDAVEIAAIVAPPATTTTTTTSTTTTTTTTTTTASTTTTTVGTTTTGSPTSTTLATGSSTTSTYATSSTTSVPGSEGSTTTLAGTTSTGEPGDTSAAGGGGTDGAPAPTGTEAQGTAGPPGGETPGTEGQTTADAQEPPGASVDDAAAERDAPAPGADEPPTTLMAVAADAAVDAALPGAALLAVVTALSLVGVVPPARARSDETAVVEDEVEPPLEEA